MDASTTTHARVGAGALRAVPELSTASTSETAAPYAAPSLMSAAVRQKGSQHAIKTVRATHGLRPRALTRSIVSDPGRNSRGNLANAPRNQLHKQPSALSFVRHANDAALEFAGVQQGVDMHQQVGVQPAPQVSLHAVEVAPQQLDSPAADSAGSRKLHILVQEGTGAAVLHAKQASLSTRQLQQAWELLQQRHLIRQPPTELYQNRLQHQIHRLQQERDREWQERYQLQQRKARLYSLRNKTPAPRHSNLGQQHLPQQQQKQQQEQEQMPVPGASNSSTHPATYVRANRNSQAAAAAHSESLKHVHQKADRTQHAEAAAGAPAGPRASVAVPACRQLEHVSHVGTALADPAFVSKLQVLKRSNQRLRASKQPTGSMSLDPAANAAAVAAVAAVHAATTAHAAADAPVAAVDMSSTGAVRPPMTSGGPNASQTGRQLCSRGRRPTAAAASLPAARITRTVSLSSSSAAVNGSNAAAARSEPSSTAAAGASKLPNSSSAADMESCVASPEQVGLIAGLLEAALQVELSACKALHQQQQQEQGQQQQEQQQQQQQQQQEQQQQEQQQQDQQQQQQAEQQEEQQHQQEQVAGDRILLLEGVGSNGDGTSIHSKHLARTDAQADAGSSSSSPSDDATDTASSISFTPHSSNVHPPQQQGVQVSDSTRHHAEHQLKPPQEQHEAGLQPDWSRNGRLRTALFCTPKWHNSRHRRPLSTSSSSPDGTSSSNSSGRGSATIAEAERQLQLLLNQTGTQGPCSPTSVWSSSRQQHTSSTCNEFQQQNHEAQQVQLQQQQGPIASTVAPGSDILSAGEVILPTVVQLQEGAQGDTAAGGDILLLEAEDMFIKMLEAASQKHKHQQRPAQQHIATQQATGHLQQHLQHQQLSSLIVHHDHPWRPPGIAPAITSPSSGDRGTKTASETATLHRQGSQQVQQHHHQQQQQQFASCTAQEAHRQQQGCSLSQGDRASPPFDPAIAPLEPEFISQQRWCMPVPMDLEPGNSASSNRAAAPHLSSTANSIAAILGLPSHLRVDSPATSSQGSGGEVTSWQGGLLNRFQQGTEPEPWGSSGNSSSVWQRQREQYQQQARAVLHAASNDKQHMLTPRYASHPSDQQQLHQAAAAPAECSSRWLQDPESWDLALCVLHEWSYQAASSNWQQIMLSFEQGEREQTASTETAQEVGCPEGDAVVHHYSQNQQQGQPATAAGTAAAAAAAAVEEAGQLHLWLHHWHQQAEQEAAASALSEQQWQAYHAWRLIARVFREWRCQSFESAMVAEVLDEQVRGFARQWRSRRAFNSWWYRFVPSSRAHALLKDAHNASADAFVVSRTQRLLGHCVAGWTAAVVVNQSARAAAEQLVQRVWLQQLLADWCLAAADSRELKGQSLVAWRRWLLQRQVVCEAAAAADEFAAATLLRKAVRSWVVAWCRLASARVFANQLQSRCQASVITALAHNVQHQQHKREVQQRADSFRSFKLLHLCVRFWRAWSLYKAVLAQAAAAVSSALRARVLRKALTAWRNVAIAKAWQHKATEMAEGFFWCRLVASQFYCWGSYAQRRAQLRLLAETVAAQRRYSVVNRCWFEWRRRTGMLSKLRVMQQQRQQQLMQQVIECWWTESVGVKRMFELQVSSLVRLVTSCFKSWQFHAHQAQQLQQHMTTWQQQLPERQQRQQTRVLQRWRDYTMLCRGWRAQAPLLAAAYYQERLIRLAWQAWQQCTPPQQQQQQQLESLQPKDVLPAQQQMRQHKWTAQQHSVLETDQAYQQQQQQQPHHVQGQYPHAPQALVQQQLHSHQQPTDSVQPGLQDLQQELSAVLLVENPQHSAEHAHESEIAEPYGTVGDHTVDVDVAGLPASRVQLPILSDGIAAHHMSQAVWHVQEDPACELMSETPALVGPSPLATAAPGSEDYAQHPDNVGAWQEWQQQQHEQQLELLQMTAAAHHHAATLAKRVLSKWSNQSSAAAAVMSSQARLKYSCHLELVQRHRQEQLVQQQRRDWLVGRPFRLWLQQVMLKRSAAAGFRCYNQLAKAFLGWTAAVSEQQQQGGDHPHPQQSEVEQSGTENMPGEPVALNAPQTALPVGLSGGLVPSDHALQFVDLNGRLLQWMSDVDKATHADQLPDIGIRNTLSTAVEQATPCMDPHDSKLPQQLQQQQHNSFSGQAQQPASLPAWMLQPTPKALTAPAPPVNVMPAELPVQQQSVIDSLSAVTCVQDLHNALLAMV